MSTLEKFGVPGTSSRIDPPALGWRIGSFAALAEYASGVDLLVFGVAGEGSGLFHPGFGSAVLVLGNVVILIGLLWWTAGRLSRLDEGARRAGRATAEREAWLRTTLASIGDAVIATDREGRVTFINPAAEAMTGWARADAAGKRLEDVFRIVDETTREPVENPASRALGEGAIAGPADHTVLIARDGAERAVDGSAATIRLGDGPVAGTVLVFRDVTSRRQVDRKLARDEQRLRMALDAARMVAWEWTPADGSLLVSANAADVFGLPRGTTLIGIEQGVSLLHPDDVAAYRGTYRKAIDERGGYLFHYRLIRPDDGRVLWMEERGHSVPDESGEVERLVGVSMDVTDRRRAEERLRDTLSRLDAILKASEIGTWEFDVAGNVIRADGQFLRMFALTPEVAAGGPVETYIEAIHPEDRALVRETFGNALRTGGRYKAEFRVTGHDGIERWIMARGQFDRDSSGEASRFPGVVVDVTGEKRAEEELRAARSRLESTLSAGEVGTWEFDAVSNVVRADRNLAGMFGVTGEEAAGGPLESYTRAIHPDDRGRVATAIGRTLESGERFEEEYRLVAAGGAVRWVVARGRVVRDESGRGVRMPGVVVDVTGRKRAEQEHARLVAASEQQRRTYETALSNTPDFNYTFDLEGRFTFANAALLALWGKGLDEAVGKDFFDLGYPPELAERLRRQIREVIETSQPVRDETPFRSHAGERQYEYILVPVMSEGGSVVAVAGSTRDITERKAMEDELRRVAADLSEADHRKDEFLATLAHELRNPLAPIRNGLQIMKMAGDQRTVDESRSLMERQVTHMVRLIDDLMDVSRITRNKLELRRERVDLAMIVRNALETSRPLVEEAGHELSVTLPARPILVDADVTRLSQVFSNLLNNAAKYTERGGDVALVAERQGSDVVVTVRDNGVGIPPEMLPRLFVMFTQVDRSLERSRGGLGIGLALVKTLVEMHGGSVEARSGGHGRGSDFVVRLPIVLAAARRAAPEADDRRNGPMTALRILVVDDNMDSARTLARLLRLLGHEARMAHDGGEAVETAERYRPELMLLDIGLPVMNGYEVARAIRGRDWGREVAIVALTGWGQEDDRRRSKEAGIDDHLVKPVDPATLEKLLSEMQ